MPKVEVNETCAVCKFKNDKNCPLHEIIKSARDICCDETYITEARYKVRCTDFKINEKFI